MKKEDTIEKYLSVIIDKLNSIDRSLFDLLNFIKSSNRRNDATGKVQRWIDTIEKK